MDLHRVFAICLRPFRKRRMKEFMSLLRVEPGTTVLDVGGSSFNWTFVDSRPKLVLCNLTLPLGPRGPETMVIADGCLLPFRDESFDITFSNSVIEHVGSPSKQQAFSRECARTGRGYFVQTPNKYFFLEPHLLTPFVHWLPKKLQPWIIEHLTLRSWISRPSKQWVQDFFATTRLLGPGEMARLFPDGEVRKERFLGWTKSIVAFRDSATGNR